VFRYLCSWCSKDFPPHFSNCPNFWRGPEESWISCGYGDKLFSAFGHLAMCVQIRVVEVPGYWVK